MIDVLELRISNWLLFDGKPERVAMIDMDLDDESEALISSLENYSLGPFNIRHGKVLPIPLTPEILEKCGFERGDNLDRDGHYSYERDGIVITNNETSFEGGWGEEIYMKVDHLHQLQNLYFALTGEELNIQL